MKLKKNGVIKRRINEHAEKLEIFTTKELANALNNLPNMHGFGKTRYQISTVRLANLLKTMPNIGVKERHFSHKKPIVWEWLK